MKKYLTLIILLLLTIPTRASSPPNILFILIDDMGWRDLTCTGSTFYETPHIDSLAKQGLLFTSAYAACPVCSPSRASILTGQYPARVGLTDYLGGKSTGKLLPAPYLKHLPLELPNLAKSLHAAGYQTWHVGKWHLGPEPFWPLHQGFDANIAGCAMGHPSSYFSPYKNPTLPDGPKGEYLTDRLTNEAITLLKNRDPYKPFYLNLWHYAVHTPIQAPPALIAKYQKKAQGLLSLGSPLTEGELFPTLQKHNQHVTRRTIQSDPAYAAMIESLDTNIGRLLQTLDDLHLSDNTLIIFTSDNGGLSTAEGSPTSNLPLTDGKGWAYEGGTRVACLARWPGHIPAGSTCDTPVTSPDFYPTLLDVASLPHPASPIDGISLLPLLSNPSTPLPPRTLFWHYPHYGNQGGTPFSSLRSGNNKLIEFHEDHHLELYNLKSDPTESHNLAPTQPDLTQKLHTQLSTWLTSVHAQLPTPNPAPFP